MNAHVRGLITISMVLKLQLHIFLFSYKVKSANNDQRDLNEPFRNSYFLLHNYVLKCSWFDLQLYIYIYIYIYSTPLKI